MLAAIASALAAFALEVASVAAWVSIEASAAACAVDTGLFTSLVLSTFPSPTCALVTA